MMPSDYNKTSSIFTKHHLLLLLLTLGGIIGVYLFVFAGVAMGILFFLLPLLFLLIIYCLSSPISCFFLLYIASYLVMGVGRYIILPLPAGVILDLLILFNFFCLSLHYIRGNPLGKLYYNPFLFISMLWMIFCLLEIINPISTFANWITTVRSIGMHIVFFQLLVFLCLDNLEKLRVFFGLWGILILLGALKAIGQKYIGLDRYESSWLYTFGAHTHVIYSGIRYFSFFTDAANFGCHMGLGIVVFTILAFYEKDANRRVFYIAVALLAVYGLMISGTRAAMAVPFVGFAFFIILVKEWKWIILGVSLLVLAFSFFNLTTIGNSNADIRRMRTAFSFSDDASFNVRLENQKKMRSFMSDHPFGIGLGGSKHANQGDVMHGIATDSSFVFIWVETGIIGLILYILMCLTILSFGTYYVLFVLQDNRIKSIAAASTAGLAGIMIAGYANEVLHQMPTGQTVYILMGIIMLSPVIDKKLSYGISTV
ncbi:MULTISPECIES: O-antigen ligase [unclassified Sphingobacterium]|uniref:O-antigen ligase family protein n=1 Tax=unclassified Sphingobacterium TaxID=2609468 RepID=UPI00104A9F46|nr:MULTISPECIES: O-antigen ligase family protein [unclassified Sphingobacterium]MCS3555793.1 O-antigen ligase [Sphingobacterium sp. JUb21]TCR00754.1 O-antigen ligase-like membrane protein [Sphingobacterium sp. JUb20]